MVCVRPAMAKNYIRCVVTHFTYWLLAIDIDFWHWCEAKCVRRRGFTPSYFTPIDWFVRHTAQHETNFVWLLSLLLLLNIWQGRRLLHNLLHHLAIRMSFPFHRHLSITHILILFLSLHLHLLLDTYFHFLVHTIRSRSISRSCEWHKTNFVEYVTFDIWLESTTNRWLSREMP